MTFDEAIKSTTISIASQETFELTKLQLKSPYFRELIYTLAVRIHQELSHCPHRPSTEEILATICGSLHVAFYAGMEVAYKIGPSPLGSSKDTP